MVSNTKAARILGNGTKAKRDRKRMALTPAQAAAKAANHVTRSLLRVSQMTPQDKLDQDARATSKEAEAAAATARDVTRMRNAAIHHNGLFSCCQKAITGYSGAVFATGPYSANIICEECQRH